MINKAIKVAYSHTDSIYKYDPATIYYDYQYILLENIYCPLITFNPEGELVSSIAQRFEWIGNDVHIKIRDTLKTIDGHEISAVDVEASLKRLFILQSNTHGDLKQMLCGDTKLSNLEDVCPNLQIKDAKTIVMRFKKIDPFLFSMLTSADFSIIPKNSIDSKTLKIVDYRNTSGPYYVEKDNGSGNIDLSANPGHFYYDKNMPQKVEIKNSEVNGKNHSLDMFEKGSIDLLTTIDSTPLDTIINYSQTHNDINLFKTIPIRLEALTFTATGETKLTREERFEIAGLIKGAILPHLLTNKGKEATIQIFPPFGQGALTREQIKDLEERFRAVKLKTCYKKFTVWNLSKDTWPQLQKIFPNAEFKYVMALPGRIDYKANGLQEPELFFHRTDTSIKEDISLFSYYMSGYLFSIHGAAGQRWINKYIETESLDERMKMFNELHYATLSKAITIPLTFSPYVALVRKPWEFKFLNLHAGTTFWRLRCN